MRQTREFNDLLRNKVNLPDWQLRTLDDTVEAVFGALKGDPRVGGRVADKVPQGSWAHRTIIRPPEGREFDADFLLRMNEDPDWHESPGRYLDAVEDALRQHGTYRRMPIDRKHRCIRLTYAGDFHVDIVPFVRRADGTTWIVDGENGQWEPTNPTGYTTWMRKKDETADGNLRRTVRLFKFLRDHHGWFGGTRSIILTTLLGERVTAAAKAADPDQYRDVPTTLLTLSEDLAGFPANNPSRPHIADPSAPGASFDHRWDDATYAVLRRDMADCAARIGAAYRQQDDAQSRRLWQNLFGPGFDAPSRGGGAATPFGAPGEQGRPGRAG